jgi:hypothetical protein
VLDEQTGLAVVVKERPAPATAREAVVRILHREMDRVCEYRVIEEDFVELGEEILGAIAQVRAGEERGAAGAPSSDAGRAVDDLTGFCLVGNEPELIEAFEIATGAKDLRDTGSNLPLSHYQNLLQSAMGQAEKRWRSPEVNAPHQAARTPTAHPQPTTNTRV